MKPKRMGSVESRVAGSNVFIVLEFSRQCDLPLLLRFSRFQIGVRCIVLLFPYPFERLGMSDTFCHPVHRTLSLWSLKCTNSCS